MLRCFHSASLDNASGPYAHSWRLFLPQHDHSVIAEPVHPIQPPYHRGHLHQHSPASGLSFESSSRPHHGKNANASATEPAPHTLGLQWSITTSSLFMCHNRDSNPRPSGWKSGILPLGYSDMPIMHSFFFHQDGPKSLPSAWRRQSRTRQWHTLSSASPSPRPWPRWAWCPSSPSSSAPRGLSFWSCMPFTRPTSKPSSLLR